MRLKTYRFLPCWMTISRWLHVSESCVFPLMTAPLQESIAHTAGCAILAALPGLRPQPILPLLLSTVPGLTAGLLCPSCKQVAGVGGGTETACGAVISCKAGAGPLCAPVFSCHSMHSLIDYHYLTMEIITPIKECTMPQIVSVQVRLLLPVAAWAPLHPRRPPLAPAH